MLVMISHTEIMPAHLFHMTGKAASRLEGKYLMAKLKINTFKAFSDIRTELQRDNVVKYLLIFSIKKIMTYFRVVKVLVQYQNDKNIFFFKDCKESQMYKMFLRKWDDHFDTTATISSEGVEEEPEEFINRNSQVTEISERQNRIPPRKTQSYVDLESDFRTIRRSFNIFERKFKRKVGTKNVKKSQTYQYLLHRTIFDVEIC